MIIKYRDSLEEFIYKQTIGPGINNNKIISALNDKICTQKYSKINPLYDSEEIVDYLPSGLYSSAIIFPIDNSKNVTSVENFNEEKPYSKASQGC